MSEFHVVMSEQHNGYLRECGRVWGCKDIHRARIVALDAMESPLSAVVAARIVNSTTDAPAGLATRHGDLIAASFRIGAGYTAPCDRAHRLYVASV